MRSASKVASASWIATAGSLSPVSPAASMPLLLEALDGLLLGALGLLDRLVGVRDPEGERRRVAGGGDDEHLGALDLLAQRGAQHVGVDGLGGDDEQLHAGCATPAPGRQTAPSRRASTTTATSSRSRPSWTASAFASIASAIAPRVGALAACAGARRAARARARRRAGSPRRRRPCRARARRPGRAATRSSLISGSRTMPSSVPGRARRLDRAVGAQHERERVPAGGEHDLAAAGARRDRRVQDGAEAVVEALAQERLVELGEHRAGAPAVQDRRRAACSGRAR